jgi:hypothetical protein
VISGCPCSREQREHHTGEGSPVGPLARRGDHERQLAGLSPAALDQQQRQPGETRWEIGEGTAGPRPRLLGGLGQATALREVVGLVGQHDLEELQQQRVADLVVVLDGAIGSRSSRVGLPRLL